MTKNEWKKNKRALIIQKLCVCYLCNRLINNNKDLSLDHIVPLSRGGADVPENWGVSHKYCNWLKGALTYQEFMQWRMLEHKRNGKRF